MGREYLDLDPAGTPTGFSAWLRSSLADAGGSDTDVVELSTFHAAKGLEWKVVHLAGVEKGLIPIHFAETQGELAEETRLFYVAITRAEDELVLHRAEKRTTGTREMRRKPSAFLEPVEAALDFLNGVEHRRPRSSIQAGPQVGARHQGRAHRRRRRAVRSAACLASGTVACRKSPHSSSSPTTCSPGWRATAPSPAPNSSKPAASAPPKRTSSAKRS